MGTCVCIILPFDKLLDDMLSAEEYNLFVHTLPRASHAGIWWTIACGAVKWASISEIIFAASVPTKGTYARDCQNAITGRRRSERIKSKGVGKTRPGAGGKSLQIVRNPQFIHHLLRIVSMCLLLYMCCNAYNFL